MTQKRSERQIREQKLLSKDTQGMNQTAMKSALHCRRERQKRDLDRLYLVYRIWSIEVVRQESFAT
jgi:hypothetical protein